MNGGDSNQNQGGQGGAPAGILGRPLHCSSEESKMGPISKVPHKLNPRNEGSKAAPGN